MKAIALTSMRLLIEFLDEVDFSRIYA